MLSERQIHFDLSPEERETIDAARTIAAGVHLVVQLGYFNNQFVRFHPK